MLRVSFFHTNQSLLAWASVGCPVTEAGLGDEVARSRSDEVFGAMLDE